MGRGQRKNIRKNQSNKIYFNEDFSYSDGENDFFYFEDKFGGLKLPKPNIRGQFQLENISTALAALRVLDMGVNDDHIKRGIQKIDNLARLQEICSGKLKKLVKNNLFLISGDHNEDGARVLSDYLSSLDCKKHLIIGMMANKQHEKYKGIANKLKKHIHANFTDEIKYNEFAAAVYGQDLDQGETDFDVEEWVDSLNIEEYE